MPEENIVNEPKKRFSFVVLKEVFRARVVPFLALVFLIFGYGLLLSACLLFFDVPPSFEGVVALGTMFYFLKYEVPEIIRGCFPLRGRRE